MKNVTDLSDHLSNIVDENCLYSRDTKTRNSWDTVDSSHRTLLDLFNLHVQQTPDKIAVEQGAHKLTYEQLNRQSDTLAYELSQQLELALEDRIAIFLPRCIEEVIALLAIIKLGCAYVPINSKDPEARVEFILSDTNAKALLTNHETFQKLKSSCPQIMIEETIADKYHDFAAKPILAESLAYVMYTSGSTGKSKGVMIQHDAVMRLAAQPDYIQLGHNERIAQVQNPAFDPATFEIWIGLLNGIPMIYPSREQLKHLLDPNVFADYLRQNKITILILPSTMFAQLAFQKPGMFKDLNYLLFGGDVANAKAIKKVIDAGKPKHILNCYGPTEDTTIATIFEITKRNVSKTIPIGHPIDQTSVYLLDEHQKPVPMGYIGEMYLGGKGLARAYLNLPEQTERQFININIDNTTKRLYRTGDFAYQDQQGNFHFVGRDDEQIKVHGYRTELSEIKQKCLEHPYINDVEIIVRNNDLGAKELVAYIVAERKISSQEIRQSLQQSLPEYMIPAYFIQLDNMPMNRNGKLDTKAFNNILPEETMPKQIKVRIEDIMTQIFSELLSIPESDVKDETFINLGGSSILLVKLVDIIRNRFDIEFGMELLFTANSPSSIAAKIREIKQKEVIANKYQTLYQVTKQTDQTKPPIVFIHPAGGNTLCYQKIIEALSQVGHACYVISEPSIKIGYAVFESVSDVAQCYLELIKNELTDYSNLILSGYSLGGMIAASMSLYATQNGLGHLSINELLLLDTWAVSRANQKQQNMLKEHLNSKYDYQEAGPEGPYLYELFQYWQDLGLAYTPNRRITTPVSLFRSNESFNDISGINLNEISNDWAVYCETLKVIPITGTHESVMRPPHIDELIKQLKLHLSKYNLDEPKNNRGRIIKRRKIATEKSGKINKLLPFF